MGQICCHSKHVINDVSFVLFAPASKREIHLDLEVENLLFDVENLDLDIENLDVNSELWIGIRTLYD